MLYQRKNPHGGDLYTRPIRFDFSANTNPFGTPESVKQAVRNSVDLLHQYPDPYCGELVQAISKYEDLSEDYILCGNGAADLIFAFCQALKPKKALELAPTFSEYSAALESVGCQIERYTLKENLDFCLDCDFLSVLENENWDCVFLCNPNNPTGQTIANELLEQIAQLCRKNNIFLFLDECFQDLCDKSAQYSMKHCLSDNSNVFILKAFTKSYGMAALRLGYGLCGNKKLLEAMSCAVQSWNISLPAQKAGIEALKEQDFLEKTNALIAREKCLIKAELEKLGFRVIDSKANYLLFQAFDGLKQILLEQGIQIRACGNYYGLSSDWFRIAIKAPNENSALLQALREVMKER